jgi:CRP/FNR family transcriptional regulator, cyclic AMP receptor protein
MPILTEDERSDLEAIGHPIRYTRGSIVLGEGEETDYALLIRKGHVMVTLGAEDRIVAFRGPGEIVGEMASILREPRSASVFAYLDVEALHLPARTWLQFLYGHPRVMHALLQQTSKRLHEATTKQADLGYLGLEQRLAKALVELEAKIGEPAPDGRSILLSQTQLAGYVGTSRETVSQLMGTLRHRGILGTGRQKITIYDLEKLDKIANGEATAAY